MERSLKDHRHTSYSSFAKLNRFSDERYTKIEDFYDPRPWKVGTGTGKAPQPPPKHGHNKGHKSPSMSHSQSEGNIDFRFRTTKDHNLGISKTLEGVAGDYDTRYSQDTDTSSSFSRGRTITRTPSPVKVLEDIKEDQASNSPPSPTKRSRSPFKQMFGENGWLGRSMSMNEMPNERYRKNGIKHWGGKIKQRVENLVGLRGSLVKSLCLRRQGEDVSKVSRLIPTTLHQRESPSKSPSTTKFNVSLSPPMQAKLYSEMELMICATANQYLNVQHKEGRMTVESLKKVTEWWASKNRPQVIEFMFDQATQRDLVLYNIKSFRFYGPNANDTFQMNAMMQSWKALCRDMSVRTFCTPDSVIRKHTHDCYKILEMLGAPLVTFMAFQEIQMKALKVMREEQKKRDEYEAIQFGVERRWEAPTEGAEEKDLYNPFG